MRSFPDLSKWPGGRRRTCCSVQSPCRRFCQGTSPGPQVSIWDVPSTASGCLCVLSQSSGWILALLPYLSHWQGRKASLGLGYFHFCQWHLGKRRTLQKPWDALLTLSARLGERLVCPIGTGQERRDHGPTWPSEGHLNGKPCSLAEELSARPRSFRCEFSTRNYRSSQLDTDTHTPITCFGGNSK